MSFLMDLSYGPVCFFLLPKEMWTSGEKPKGAGVFHSAGQSRVDNSVLALPSIRFAWNFYQIISGTKYE